MPAPTWRRRSGSTLPGPAEEVIARNASPSCRPEAETEEVVVILLTAAQIAKTLIDASDQSSRGEKKFAIVRFPSGT